MQSLEKLSADFLYINSEDAFNEHALALFNIHYANNNVYRRYIDFLNPSFIASDIKHYSQIPYLPIELFKTQEVILQGYTPIDYFSSSGTTNSEKSTHHIVDFSPYENSFTHCFTKFWGNIEDYCILALLPNYMEQKHSSLIYMVQSLMEQSKHLDNGFYLNNHRELIEKLRTLENRKQKTILFGVSYALLDLTKSFPFSLKYTSVLETGGMKGRRKEMIREELHTHLCKGFDCTRIYSEYGMAELFSQAYLQEEGFVCPSWMKILIRNMHDPLAIEKTGKSGGINVIDLANIYSCPFIATQDIGKLHVDGSFEVLGRFDQSDVRGCNLLII